MRWSLTLPLVFLLHCTGHTADDFNYKDTDSWGGECQTGKRQSPIDLKMKLASFERVEEMYFLRYDEANHFEIQNNGHSIKLKLDMPCNYGIVGGRLPNVYTLDHIHFHWKAEHLVDGKRLPLEAHFVHYRRDYKSVDEAADKPDGLAVLGVLFEESESENKVLREMIPYFSNTSTVETPKYHLAPQSLLPKYKASFFRYGGSLTTPPCYESVVWTVFRDRLPISKSQIAKLKKIMFNGDAENFRPIQKLNRRPLYIMTFEDRFKPTMNCAKPSQAQKAMCFLLTMAGVVPVLRR